jgi:hypothetical protein
VFRLLRQKNRCGGYLVLFDFRLLKNPLVIPAKGDIIELAEARVEKAFATLLVAVFVLSTTSFTPSIVSIDLISNTLSNMVITTTHTLEIIKKISDI